MLKVSIKNNYIIYLKRLISFCLAFFIAINLYPYRYNITPNQSLANNSTSIDSIESLDHLIKESERYWSINRKVSDSLISRAFIIIENKKISDSTLLAEAYHILGKNLINKREYQSGIDTFKKCNLIKQLSKEDSKSISKTLNYIGVGYMYIQKYDSAILYCHKAKDHLLRNNISDINLYYSILNIGIFYARQGKYSSSLTYFDTAQILVNSGELANDSSLLAGFYENYALITTFTGKLKQANKYYDFAEKMYGSLYGPNHIKLAGINNNKGINAYYEYEFSKAELYYKKALDLELTEAQKNSDLIAMIHINLSKIYQDKGDYNSTIKSCLEGLKYSQSDDLNLIMNKNIATSYAEIGDNVVANNYFQIALELLKKESINPKRAQDLYVSYADFLLNNNNNELSLKYYNKALLAANNLHGRNSNQYADILTSIGTYYLDALVNIDSAISYFSQSISIFTEDNTLISEDNYNSVQQKEAEIGLASAYFLKHTKTKEIVYLYKADSIYNNVLRSLEEISHRLSNTNRLIVIELMNPVYIKAVETSHKLYSLTNDEKYLMNISNYMERSKSSSLLAEVNSEFALKTSDLPIELFNREHQIKDEINGLRQLLENENSKQNPNQKNISYFESKLLNLVIAYDSLIINIETKSPKYYSIKYNNKVVNINDIKKNLENDEILLEYLLTDSIIYVLAVSQNDFNIVAVPIDSSFLTSLNYLISLKYVDLSEQTLIKFNEFKFHSHNLWKILIRPHEEFIADNRLIIIPDGLLGYLPFDLLIEYELESDHIAYRDLPYLLKNHPISYSYSATLKYNTYFESDKESINNDILAFAPSYDLKSSDSLKLNNLPFAKTEVQNIINNHQGTVFTDNQATKSIFKENAGSANILHLAMHAIINDSLPLQSKLVFFKSEADTNTNYLFTHELYNMDLNASLVTLSACNTGTGKFSKGEGIMSLARGFVYAGIPSVIMTLWEVQDATGSKIMDNFYGLLSKGLRKDEALQQAKLATLKDANMANAHPFFWSTYTINGDTSSITVSNEKNYFYWIISISIILIILLGLKKTLNKSRS